MTFMCHYCYEGKVERPDDVFTITPTTCTFGCRVHHHQAVLHVQMVLWTAMIMLCIIVLVW